MPLRNQDAYLLLSQFTCVVPVPGLLAPCVSSPRSSLFSNRISLFGTVLRNDRGLGKSEHRLACTQYGDPWEFFFDIWNRRTLYLQGVVLPHKSAEIGIPDSNTNPNFFQTTIHPPIIRRGWAER